MNTIEVTIEFKGAPVKIRSGRVFAPFFGTTYYNQSMHWEWSEVPVDKLSRELKKHLIDNKLIKP